jgi:L-ascorbate metabolism protein UlaG (beta-lactamase superfamily)
MGGIFTMDAYQASHAAAMLKPAMVLPIHYGSFPIIAQTPEEFVGLAAQNAPGIKVLTPDVGEQVVLG